MEAAYCWCGVNIFSKYNSLSLNDKEVNKLFYVVKKPFKGIPWNCKVSLWPHLWSDSVTKHSFTGNLNASAYFEKLALHIAKDPTLTSEHHIEGFQRIS